MKDKIKLFLDNGIIIESPYGYSISQILKNLPKDIIKMILEWRSDETG